MEAMAELATVLCERMLESLRDATPSDDEGHAPLINVNFPDRPQPRGILATNASRYLFPGAYQESVDSALL